MKRQQEAVRFVYDPRDMRRQERMERQKAIRRAERITLLQQSLFAVLMFCVMVWASGILR
jgi:uncharacterized membrane protein YccC